MKLSHTNFYMLKLFPILFLFLTPLFGKNPADQIIANARYASSLNNIEFKGKFKKGFKSTPILLKMLGNDIQLYYQKDGQDKGIQLKLDQNNCTLYNISSGQRSKFPTSQFGASIEGTDFTYEDLSLRFLYWNGGNLLMEEKIKTRECYKVRVNNPGNAGNYKYADLWIDKKSFALMKMQGYDAQARHIKTLEPTDLMNVDDKIMMKKMKVRTMENGRTKSESSLILENPEGILKNTNRPRKMR